MSPRTLSASWIVSPRTLSATRMVSPLRILSPQETTDIRFSFWVLLVEIILYISKSSFAINFDALEIEVPSVQRQSGDIDCGLFAIAFAFAFAFELASGNEHTIQSKQFEQHRMRDHLIRCLARMASSSLSQDRLTASGKEKIQTFLRSNCFAIVSCLK